jgi:hypothetical protein
MRTHMRKGEGEKGNFRPALSCRSPPSGSGTVKHCEELDCQLWDDVLGFEDAENVLLPAAE